MVTGTFAVIGAGSIGQRHARNLAALGHKVDLIPYREFDPANFAGRGDIAGVVIATATQIRLELVTGCAAQGWPFYIEKPLGWTAAQIAAIYDAAAPVADRSMLGLMMRYHPIVRALAARDLSDVYNFTLHIGHDVRQWRENWSFADSYASDPAGGGVLLDLCHELDIAHCLFPQVRVAGASSLDHRDFTGVDFITQVSLASPPGAVTMDYLSPVSLRKAQLCGTKQIIMADLLAATLSTTTAEATEKEVFTNDRNGMFLAAMQDFVALATGRAPSDNPLIPRLPAVRSSCDLIASAWAARQFTGQVALTL